MLRNVRILVVLAAGLIAGYFAGGSFVSAQNGAASIAAVAGQKGGQDIFGPYDVVAGWPKDLTTIPGHEAWTFGGGSSVYAESANRVYAIQHGELPNLKRPATKKLSDMGPSIFFPIGRLPWRDTTSSSPPGNGGTGQLAEEGMQAWERAGNKMGVDARWEHNIMVFDREGNLHPDTANFLQWDSAMQRPHAITVNPYDPDRAVWFVDDHKHIIYKFSRDGKTKLATWGTYGVPGADSTHFNRPTFIDFFPDGGFVVADGYNGTRFVKFDKDGKFAAAWGEKGSNQNDTRPGFFNNVHGIAVDPQTRRIFVNDRGNHRVQVFDENGKFLDQWRFGDPPSDVHMFHISADRYLWAADRGTNKILKYDLEGHFLYSWGAWGDFPGGFWGVHDFSTDEEGNFYISEVDKGGAQKFRPRQGANPAYMVGKPVRKAW
ncbi:MAG: 6-bladed beta-propeller [Vicinamibacterales bacterium]